MGDAVMNPVKLYPKARSDLDVLRDQFAAAAMQGAIAATSNAAANPNPDSVARYAYEVADAMMSWRAKK